MRTAYGKYNVAGAGCIVILFFIACAMRYRIAPMLPVFSAEIDCVWKVSAACSAALTALLVGVFLLRYGILHGTRYFTACLRICIPLRKALLDANYSITRYGLIGEYEELPKIRIELGEDAASIKVLVENSIR